MGSWYSDLVSHRSNGSTHGNLIFAARSLAGNWRRFEAFGWLGKPDHRPETCAILYLANRDSDAIDRSNEAMILEALRPALGDLNDGDLAETCRHSHWAVGHVTGIVIRCVDDDGAPTWAFAKLYELAQRLNQYPILNDDHHSQIEQQDADQTWKTCYSDAERLAYVREHRRDFEFSNMADLMGCIRGKYFAGIASDLLGG